MDVDGEGNVLGVEFPSLKEYTELVTHSGGVLELADKIEDPVDLSLPLVAETEWPFATLPPSKR